MKMEALQDGILYPPSLNQTAITSLWGEGTIGTPSYYATDYGTGSYTASAMYAQLGSFTYQLTENAWAQFTQPQITNVIVQGANTYADWGTLVGSYGSMTIGSDYVPETAEQRVEREARELEYTQRRAVATSRAEELLLMVIGDKKRRQYIEHQYFDVEVSGRTYRIHKGRSMNVVRLGPDGKPLEHLCAHPKDLVPDPDTMLSQFLMLTSNEQEFLNLANKRAA